jgi:hypothetical protein
MVYTIEFELPDNKKEADFILELLKRLNVRFTQKKLEEETKVDALIEANKTLLYERLDAIEKGASISYTWEETQEILNNRKLQPA